MYRRLAYGSTWPGTTSVTLGVLAGDHQPLSIWGAMGQLMKSRLFLRRMKPRLFLRRCPGLNPPVLGVLAGGHQPLSICAYLRPSSARARLRPLVSATPSNPRVLAGDHQRGRASAASKKKKRRAPERAPPAHAPSRASSRVVTAGCLPERSRRWAGYTCVQLTVHTCGHSCHSCHSVPLGFGFGPG